MELLGNLFDMNGTIVKVGDEIEIVKILEDGLGNVDVKEGEIVEVSMVDLEDINCPLRVKYFREGETNIEWLETSEVEVKVVEKVKEAKEIVEDKTVIDSEGLRMVDAEGTLTLKINSEGEIVSDDVARIRTIVKRQMATFIAKNDDYGDSVLKGRKIFGAMSELTRLSDKIHRFYALVDKEETAKVAESLDDTVMDMVNYMCMYYIDLEAINVLEQMSGTLVQILQNPRKWLSRLSNEMCMEHILNPNDIEFDKLVDRMEKLR